MPTTNANDLILNAINSGAMTHEQANALVRGVGITVMPGEGRVKAAFESDVAANSKALKELEKRGLLPQTSIQQHTANQVNNPDLPSGTELTPQLQLVQQGELQTAQQISAPTVTGPGAVQAPKTTAQVASLDDVLVGYEDALKKISQGSGTYQASQVGTQTPQAVAAQGNVSELATIQGQLKKLYAESEDGQVPLWAQGAVRKAEDVLASRGLGASSISAGAITAAIQESAINIAAPDAATYFQMDIKNLDNEQQTRLENVRLRQQSLLTDVAATNAARQFNAASTQDIQKFQAQLVADIQTSNANRVASMRQFNTAEVNRVEMANTQLKAATDQFNNEQALAIETFNSSQRFQASRFNAEQAAIVDQSNVVWRRSINTANTAAINAANQVNVQNKFNLSNYALNTLWQNIRDESNYLFTASQSELDYQRRLGLLGAQTNSSVYLTNLQNDATQLQDLYKSLGALGTTLIKKL